MNLRRFAAALADTGPVLVLASIAGAGSFTHIRDTATQHGQHGPVAWAVAVCIERAKRPRSMPTAPGTVWTPAQLAAFLVAARPHRLFAFFHVAAYTGARRGELLNLHWSDIDLDGKKIIISGSTGIINGERVDGTTKSGRSPVVIIDDDTVAVLKEHRKAQAAEQLLAGADWRGNVGGHVFTTGWGEQIYPDTVGALMAKIIRNHNVPTDGPRPKEPLPHARVHDLRHIHATTLLLNGVPVHVVAARLGHADPAITLRVYAHIIRAAETAAAEVFARIMSEAVKFGAVKFGAA